MHRQREVSKRVLGEAGRYHEVAENLRVKQVWIEGRRQIMCHSPQEAAKDEAGRKAIEEAAVQPASAMAPKIPHVLNPIHNSLSF